MLSEKSIRNSLYIKNELALIGTVLETRGNESDFSADIFNPTQR